MQKAAWIANDVTHPSKCLWIGIFKNTDV